MTDAAFERLARELDGPLPSGLDALSATEINRLADAVVLLKQKQASDLSTALEKALSHIPALLRGTVRKILFS